MNGDAIIPTLLDDWRNGICLGIVPGYTPEDDTGSRDSGWRARWFAWRDAVHAYRADLHRLCERDRTVQQIERALCEQDPNRFITLWGWIHEPRPRRGEDKIKPFTQMAFQVKLNDDAVTTLNLEEPRDTAVSKTRGCGMTWNYCALAVWGWNYHEWVMLCVSRKEDLVDKPGDLNSIFGKMLFIIDRLPPFLLPDKWERDQYRNKNLITHPNGISILQGESTTSKAGVGGRATGALVDETAKIPDLLLTLASLDGTTDHKLMGSTEDFDVSHEWWDVWHAMRDADPSSVFEIDYYHNPYFDQTWYDNTRARMEAKGDLVGFEREYLRNPFNREAMVYGMIDDVPWTDDLYDPELPLVLGGIDPGRADDTAIVWAQPESIGPNCPLRWIKCYEKRYMPAEFYAHILTGLPPEEGDPCWPYWQAQADPMARDRFTPGDLEIMRWTQELPWEPDKVRYFMDPSGANKDLSGLSFHDRLMAESKRLRTREAARLAKIRGEAPRVYGIAPLYEELFKRNEHEKLRLAMRTALLRSKISRTERMKRWRDAFKNYKFRKQTPNATSEPTPIHDDWSHLVKASEYLATYAALQMDQPRKVRARVKSSDPYDILSA